MTLYLGIDGGGTKTTASVATESSVVGTATAGGSNATRFSPEQVREALHTSVRDACQRAGVDPSEVKFACIGAAGSSRPEIQLLIRNILAEIVPGTIDVVGDMVVAHEAAFFGDPGVVVVAGSGSIAYGRNERGEIKRAGGWGHAISDEGSGYWIGRRAVSLSMRASDAGHTTALVNHILHTWHLATREDVARLCNSSPAPDFASLFPAVQAAAAEGDSLASNLLVEAANELATIAKIVARRLWPGSSQVAVAMAGGVFLHSAQMQQLFVHAVRAERAEATFRITTLDPVSGAVMLARKMAAAGTSHNSAVVKP